VPFGLTGGVGAMVGRYPMESGHRVDITKPSLMIPFSEMALFPFVPVRPIDYRVTQCVPLRIFRSQRVGRVAKGLGRGPEGTKETAPHSLTIAKSCGRSDATSLQSEAYPFLMREGVCVIGAHLGSARPYRRDQIVRGGFRLGSLQARSNDSWRRSDACPRQGGTSSR
jgi:hypothetical protein